MGARRRPKLRGGSRGKPRSDIARMLQDYFQPALRSLELASTGIGGDARVVLVDNSADYSNKVLKWTKLTIRPFYDAVDMGGENEVL